MAHRQLASFVLVASTCNSPALLLGQSYDPGDWEWGYQYEARGDEVGRSVEQTNDGGYVVAGYTNSLEAGGFDVLVVRTDACGCPVWKNTYGGTEDDVGHSVQALSDGGFIVAGVTRSFGAGGSDVYLLKIRPDGKLHWQRTFGGSTADVGQSVQQTADGGFIIAG
jgi:hypothetical protein